ncbi:pseudouridine synthase [Pelagibacterium montanilacus]|uniref:pseudouridine synthase n=1 Tax=Pelagibacterium montanilacus TaxID=2185280 RepID=UPI000F8D612F|nr:pseudouridine synthase [Pelagibacterium montanilacus]
MSENSSPSTGERLAKVIARAGICSRRDAEAWIAAGRVSVNGSPVRTPAFNVTDKDTIAVDDKPVARREATALWLYHKPAGLMVTEKDPEGRPTVFQEFEHLGLPRVVTVGRLDFNTEGLLLLTNDGGLKRTLELPSTGWVRRYRVRAFGAVTQEQLDTLNDGITVEGVTYGPIEAALDSVKGANVWLTLGLREGKNREVRNVLSALGLEVNRLIRLSYGPFQLGDLPQGAVEKVKPRILRDQLGTRLAEHAGADFDAPETGRALPGAAPEPRRRMPEREPSRPTERDRHGGLRKRPEGRARPEPREREKRTLHFDDGRPSQTFVPDGPGRDARDGEGRPGRGDRSFGADRPRREGGGKPFARGPRDNRTGAPGDKPFRRDGDRPGSRGPRPDRAESTERRPYGDRPASRDDAAARPGSRPARKPFDRAGAPGASRPDAERSRDRRDAKPGARADARPGGRPSGKPAGQRFGEGRDAKPGMRSDSRPGGRPFGKPEGKPGGRPSGKPAGGRDARPGTRSDARPAGRPSGKPGGRPLGKPEGRPGGRPAGKPTGARPGPRRPDGPRPPRKPRDS